MFTRRGLILGACCSATTSLWSSTQTFSSVAKIRPDASSSQGKAMLVRYRDAVKRMKDEAEFPRHDPRSWAYQANIHWIHPSDELEIDKIFSSDGLTPEEAAVVKERRDLAIGPSDSIWSTCRHVDAAEYFFLAWHRHYLWHFESIICSLVGEDFALPYWNYHLAGQNSLPVEFREPIGGSQKANPLYHEYRKALVNSPVKPGTIDSAEIDFKLAFQSDGMYKSDVMRGFNRRVNNRPHGAVHVWVGLESGPDVGMGDVPTAGRDPIFWLHHANIDRLWEMWRRTKKGKDDEAEFSLTPEWKSQTFFFADRAGMRANVAAIRALDLPALGYEYDNYESPSTTVPVLVAAAEQSAVVVAISDSAVTVSVTGGEIPMSVVDSSVTVMATPGRVESAILELYGVRVPKNPGVSYEVRIKFGSPDSLREELVGRFNVWGFAKGHSEHNLNDGHLVEIDATKAAADLNKAENLSSFSVDIRPVGGRAVEPIMIEGARFVVTKSTGGN